MSFCLGITFSQSNNELDFEKIKEKVKEKIDINQIQSQLPDGIKIPNELLNASLPSLEETTKVLKEKCIKVSGSDAAYEEAAQGAQKLNECITNLVNVTVLMEEIEKATRKLNKYFLHKNISCFKINIIYCLNFLIAIGDLDTVFNKYCRKRDVAINCVRNFTDTIDPCLEPQERENKKIMIDIFTSLVNFVCHKDGDQIACE